MQQLSLSFIKFKVQVLFSVVQQQVGDHVNWHTTFSAGISGEKVEIDPVTNQKASTKFWIRQKPISIDSDHLCACDLVEERSPSEWTRETGAYFSLCTLYSQQKPDLVPFLPQFVDKIR